MQESYMIQVNFMNYSFNNYSHNTARRATKFRFLEVNQLNYLSLVNVKFGSNNASCFFFV